MNLLATLSESMTWTQKQILGFIVIAGLLLLGARHAWKHGNKLAVITVAVVVAFLARGIGAPQ